MLLRLTPGYQFGQGQRRFLGRDPEQGLECRHRRVAPVEPKYKLVQITLEILWINAVMCSVEPSLEVAKDSVDVRSNPMRSFWSADGPERDVCSRPRPRQNTRASHRSEALSQLRYFALGIFEC
jgi:hypothetical protein